MNQHINDVSLQTLIKLNNKIRNSDNTDLATDMKIIHQMRLELGKMIFKLHNLHLKVNDTLDQTAGNKHESDDSEYYYMTMYESLINSVKELINTHENKLLLKKNGSTVDFKPTPLDLQDILGTSNSSREDNSNFQQDLASILDQKETLVDARSDLVDERDTLVDVRSDLVDERDNLVDAKINLADTKKYSDMDHLAITLLLDNPTLKSEQINFMNDLKLIGKDPILFSPEKFIEELKLNTQAESVSRPDPEVSNPNTIDINNLLSSDNAGKSIELHESVVNDLLNTVHMVLLHNKTNNIPQGLSDIWSKVDQQTPQTVIFMIINCDTDPEIGANLGYNGGINILKIFKGSIEQFNKEVTEHNLLEFSTADVIEHSHEHTHEHSHEHTHEHSHEHTHEHTHVHPHEHTYEYTDEDPDEHPHLETHDHSSTRQHHKGYDPLQELFQQLVNPNLSGQQIKSADTLSSNIIDGPLPECQYKLKLYHNPQCIHCIEFYPIWEELCQLVSNRPIKLEKIDCMENIEQCQQDGIEGTPTIILENILTNETTEFQEERTTNNLLEFIDRHINNIPTTADVSRSDPDEYVFNETYLILYYATWCSYSTNFLPVWNELQNHLVGVNTIKIVVDEKSDWHKYKLKHVPTIDLLKNNKLYRYGCDDRSLENILHFVENPEQGLQTGGATSELILFYADWCGHCQNFKPDWEKIKSKKDLNINFVEYNADIHADEINKYGIEGYPTIILKNGDTLHKFENSRTIDNIVEFVQKYS